MMNEVHTIDCLDYMIGVRDGEFDVVVYDPPFNIWDKMPKDLVRGKTTVCFTNPKNRRFVEDIFGPPRVEVIWNFNDGRWVSNKMPRHTHEIIYIYGELRNDCYVGEYNVNTEEVKKGKSSIGKWTGGDRVYKPRERKMLNSVINSPRIVGKKFGVWGKPDGIVVPIMDWLCSEGDSVFDPFCGSGSFIEYAAKNNLLWCACEIDPEYAEIARKRVAAAMQGEKI